jgi:superfamily II DNA or RNA helicase
MGRVHKEPELAGGEWWYLIRFAHRSDNVVEEGLVELADEDETLENLTQRGTWGRLQAFRSALAVERISNDNRSTVYAYRSQRVLFEPHQYKPLLKLLDSFDRRLLIADEVGLGKTIEAGLILAELEARRQLDRVLVVCPSRLRDKWREELTRKFDQAFDVFDQRAFAEQVATLQEGRARRKLRAIISMQSLRSDDARLLLTAELGHLDLVIVDEAHHARNPGTQTSALLRDLCEVADAVLLLTATPVHLGSRDLFTLLSALRPSEFRDEHSFDQDLRQHAKIHEASRLIRSQQSEALSEAAGRLEEVFTHGILPELSNPLAEQLIVEMRSRAPADRGEWIDLERRVQDLHLLSSIVTRSRKRDVQEKCATRRANVIRCPWSNEEDRAYQQFVGGPSSNGWLGEGLSIGQVQRARQAASCLPAALDNWKGATTKDDDATEQCDILPSEMSGAKQSAESTRPLASDSLAVVDGKFKKFRELLEQIWQAEPNTKVLVFTYFVGTAKYLVERLKSAGISTLRIAGDVPSDPRRPAKDERGKRLTQFRTDPGIKVLVSTEVGSEGLDFQFCHHVVNYDLPWNPMVVEQRIGRIDRFGQKSDIVHIHNFVVQDTVEDRILERLYDRIGLFKESIGDLETILGDTISELRKDYVSGKLSPVEAEERLQRAANAIEARQQDLKRLEQNTSELFGHEEYIRDELARIGRLGRFVSENQMLALIQSFLEGNHPSAKIWKEDDSAPIFGCKLIDGLRHALQDAALANGSWMAALGRDHLRFTFSGEAAFQYPDVELVNVAHPLLQAALLAMKEQLQSPRARVGKAMLRLPRGDEGLVPQGIIYLVVYVNTVDGIRARRLLDVFAWSEAEQRLLAAEDSERLMYLALEQGEEWESPTDAPAMNATHWQVLIGEARSRTRRLKEREERESQALYTRRRTAIESEYKIDRELKQRRLETALRRESVRIIPALRGQLEKAEADFRAKLNELDTMKSPSIRLSEPLAACVIEIL